MGLEEKAKRPPLFPRRVNHASCVEVKLGLTLAVFVVAAPSTYSVALAEDVLAPITQEAAAVDVDNGNCPPLVVPLLNARTPELIHSSRINKAEF